MPRHLMFLVVALVAACLYVQFNLPDAGPTKEEEVKVVKPCLGEHHAHEGNPEERARCLFEDCQFNVEKIQEAVLAYIKDTKKDPKSLQELVPRHLECIPVCPGCLEDTYSKSYSEADQGPQTASRPRTEVEPHPSVRPSPSR